MTLIDLVVFAGTYLISSIVFTGAYLTFGISILSIVIGIGLLGSLFLTCLPIVPNFKLIQRYPHYYPCVVGLAVVSLIVCIVSFKKSKPMLKNSPNKKNVQTFELIASILLFVLSFPIWSALIWLYDFGIG